MEELKDAQDQQHGENQSHEERDGEVDDASAASSLTREDNRNRQSAGNGENEEETGNEPPIKLYKSIRLKGYITIFLSSFINYDAAQQSSTVITSIAVPSTTQQRRYTVAVSVVSLFLSAGALIAHLDRVTPFQKLWINVFKKESRIELALILFLVFWWSIACGIDTTVTGICGDGKGQYSLYYSTWTCVLASYWLLERWFVDCNLASFRAFIASWPNRAPGWLCILILNTFTFVWYLDLWRNFDDLNDGRTASFILFQQFVEIKDGIWGFLISVTVLTFLPSLAFVVAEIFRETKDDGSNEEKGRAETTAEGICLLILIVAWIPAIMIATTPGGPASLIGNAYFFSWCLALFIAETAVWFVHDLREKIHKSLKERNHEYYEKQRKVLMETAKIQRQETGVAPTNRTLNTEFHDAVEHNNSSNTNSNSEAH